MRASLLSGVEMAPRDPILGVTEAFHADPNPQKVNLGVGIYYDERGQVPLLECVRRAEQALAAAPFARPYLPIDGLAAYNRAVQELVFGSAAEPVRSQRVVTVQTLGGTGALRVCADFVRRLRPRAPVWISDPTWENHQALFEYAGYGVHTYPYYDPETRGLAFERMMGALARAPRGALVVLHACCHNPTGVDPAPEQWQEVVALVNQRGLVPVLDFAYQGFAEGLEADAAAVRRFAESCPAVFVASSFSKSLSLYGERLGALSVVTASAEEATRVLSQLKRVIRTSYSNPPTHGARAAVAVLTTPELRELWERELGAMRERIKAMRRELVERIRALRSDFDFSFVVRQRGLFSYSGLTREQVRRLREEHALYAIDSGRICIAALNPGNIERVARAIASVLV